MSPLPRGRASLPPEATAFLQRARILDATARAVAAAGFSAVSVRDIQQRAGVSRGTFYAHFDDKEDAAVEAVAAAMRFGVPRVVDAFRAQEDWTAGVEAALGAYRELLDCDRDWSTLYLVELPAVGPRVMAQRDRALEPVLGVLRSGSPSAARSTLSPRGLLAAVDGVLRSQIVAESHAETEEQWDHVVDLVLGLYGGVRRARRARELRAGPSPLSADRAARLVGALPDPVAERELTRLLEAARARQDGMVLWRAVLAFRALRLSRPEVGVSGLEQQVLGALPEASFFGVPLDASEGPWAVPSAARECLAYVAAHPGCSGQEIRLALGFAHLGTVSRLMRRLEAAGLIEHQPNPGRAYEWRTTEAAAELLKQP